MVTKKTAWYNEEELPKDMIEGANGNKLNFKKLEDSNHFPTLENLIALTECRRMADIGCGAGEVGRVFGKKINYTGYDLPHIIEKVGKEINPELDFACFDANESDFAFLENYDLILCNGFISELTNPLEILGKILNCSKEFVIVHRQFIDAKTSFEDYVTYGNLLTPRSTVGRKDLTALLKEKKFQIIEMYDSESWGQSFLLKRRQ